MCLKLLPFLRTLAVIEVLVQEGFVLTIDAHEDEVRLEPLHGPSAGLKSSSNLGRG